ncbi:MAG: hypothetical protein V1740_00055 [Candidatus Woesearchaeota archaeon]
MLREKEARMVIELAAHRHESDGYGALYLDTDDISQMIRERNHRIHVVNSIELEGLACKGNGVTSYTIVNPLPRGHEGEESLIEYHVLTIGLRKQQREISESHDNARQDVIRVTRIHESANGRTHEYLDKLMDKHGFS